MWKELIKNEVWFNENFLPQEVVRNLLNQCREAQSFTMAPGEGIRQVFDSIDVNPTLYDYAVRYIGLRKNTEVVESYVGGLNELFESINEEMWCFKEDRPLELFAKSFNPNSFYEIHAEPTSRYGQFSFVHFLEDCDGGELVFPSDADVQKLVAQDSTLQKAYEGTAEVFQRLGESLRSVGPLKVSPAAGACVVFRTGSLHWVEPPQPESLSQRMTVTGWPFVS